jgi:hypothetical protein
MFLFVVFITTIGYVFAKALDYSVGMVGLSYSGILQLYAASTNPPSLSAITPLSTIEDPWDAFRTFVMTVARMHARDRGLKDVLSSDRGRRS